jgi:hypothetical protein
MTLKTSRPRFSCTPRSVSISVATVCTHRLWIFTLVPVSSAQTTGEARSCSMIVSTTSASSRSSPQFLQVAGACVMVVLATRRTRCAPGDPGCLPWGRPLDRAARACARRSARDWRAAIGSDDGGFEEFSELRLSSDASRPIRSCNDRTSVSSSTMRASRCPMTSCEAASCSASSSYESS